MRACPIAAAGGAPSIGTSGVPQQVTSSAISSRELLRASDFSNVLGEHEAHSAKSGGVGVAMFNGKKSSRQDGLSSPSTTSEEAPFAVRATTCDDAQFVFRASLPVKSPNWLLRCGDSNRPRVPRGVLWSSGDPFVPPSPARAGSVIGSRGDHRRDRTVAIDRISHGTIQTCELRRWGL
jgi:hypothetical protein